MTNIPTIMRIEQLHRTVESYLKSRAAIMRVLNDQRWKPSELEATTNVPYAKLFRRRNNAAQWRSSELQELAQVLGLSPDPIAGVKTLAPQLQSLPDLVRGPLLKESGINIKKIVIRANDYDYWQFDELERLAGTLRRWQDTNTGYQLMASRK